MSDEDQQIDKAVIAIMAACAAFPVAVSLAALPDALGGLVASAATDRAAARKLSAMMQKRVAVVVFERMRDAL